MVDVEKRLANRARGKEPSPIRELLKYLKIDGMISLGGGYPNPDTFVFESVDIRFKGGATATLEGKELSVASQYGPSDSHVALKTELTAWHKSKDGVELGGDQLVVLNGCQEGLFIMAYVFTDEDDSIALSEPAY
ncbi:aminotransferase class I/II-fold pyridoxal phosphate-dependent enzyme, partial [bacterium]|nr:aminotransferase class I/II-fold pyridoxal phosphate-dependent enzyme [bacterium]